MSDTEQPQIDFSHAQFEAPTEAACTVCKQPFSAPYYSVNGHGVCEPCLAKLREGQRGSFGKALGLGTLAGIAGAVVYYAISAITGYNLALITIVVGIAVGIAVRRGAGGSQNRGYRLLAVAITWVSMCSTYAPDLAKEFGHDGGPTGAIAMIGALILSQIVPFLLIANAEVLALIIFAFGIWEAWRRSAAAPFVVAGPIPLARAAAPETAPEPSPAPEPAAS